MKRPASKLIATLALLALACAGPAVAAPPQKGDDPDPRSVDPASALQGETTTVTVSGFNFAEGASVRYLVAGTRDNSQVTVLSTTFISPTELITEIAVLDTATVSLYDVEVQVGRRKGKGTELFSVAPGEPTKGECSLEFDAIFVGTSADGLRVDDTGLSYPAGGGPGFRLDTNGSMKLERDGDERHMRIDFGAHGEYVDEIHGCDADDPLGAETATGFCSDLKGVDMRIEHQVQYRPGLCSLGWGGEASDDWMYQTVVVNFLAGDGGELVDPDRKGGGPEPLKLNYGCLAQGLDAGAFMWDRQAKVKRLSEYEWLITGEWACLHTQLGVLWGPVDEDGNVTGASWFNMPFALLLTDVNKPAE